MEVQASVWVVILLVALALAFDFMNGFHDAANAIATIVSTGVLKPGQAVVFASFFNFIAIFVFHLSVAATVGKGIVQPGVVDTHVVFGALVGAISWNVITWYFGIPSSSSHALIGGIVGAVVVKAGGGALVSAGIIKTVDVARGNGLCGGKRHCAAPMDGGGLLPGHRLGYFIWRLAHRTYHGPEDYQAQARGRFLRGDRWRLNAFYRHWFWYSRLDHAHHYWCNCGCGFDPAC